MTAPVRELVIVGRDAPLWLSAAVMHCALAPSAVNITAIELPPQSEAADLYVTLPALEPLHSRLRIDEGRLISATGGAFTLGRRYLDAAGKTPAFFHAHGSNGSRIGQKEFLPHWLRARREGMNVPFGDFSLTAAAARRGRMLLPDAAIDSFGFTDYAYHLPAIAYGAWLREFAIRRGVHTHSTKSLDVHLDEQGAISALLLDEGRRMAGDFFLDVSGREALLAKTLGAEVESWRHLFAADRVMSAHGALLTPVPVYSEVRAHVTGWVSLAASQFCMYAQQVYSSEFTTESAARAPVAGLPLQGTVIREVHPGRRRQAWLKNCVALGEAACVFDPLHSVDLQALQMGLVHLLPLFPVRADFTAETAEYNTNLRDSFERLRDFQSAHYLLGRYGTENSPFWNRARDVLPSRELAHKIDAFRARGESVYYEQETFGIDDWQSLFMGHGLIPESWDPAADRTSPDVLAGELRRILGFIRQKVEEQPVHAQYLRNLCAPRAQGPARPAHSSRIQ
jgi:tryptophan halogenase